MKESPGDKQLLARLKSPSIAEIQLALDEIGKNGKVEFILPLLEIYRSSKQEVVVKRIEKLFISLKLQTAAPIIMEAIADENYTEKRQFLVSLAWQTSLDFSKYFNDFVNLLIASTDFMVAFEAYTVLENIEGKFTVEELQMYIQKLKNASIQADEQRKALLVEIVHLLEQSKQD